MTAVADNKIEIKLIADYREFLLGKIESLKDSLNNVASSFGNEITSSIEEFSKRINGKLKTIDERFTKNTEELETLRTELLSKKFDESNFNNVSIIRTLDKTIKERDLKIKELESRIRYLEGNSTSASTSTSAIANTVAKKEPEGITKQKSQAIATKEVVNVLEPISVPVPVHVPVPVTSELEKDDKFKDAPRMKDADGDVVIAVSAKRSRSKTDKKKTEPANATVIQESRETVESVVEEKPKKPIRKIKKASKVEKEEESSSEPVIPIQVPTQFHISVPEPENKSTSVEDEYNDGIEAQRLADEEALRLAEEEAAEAERIAEEQRIAEEEAADAERLADEKRLEEERAVKAATELEKKKKTEVVKKTGVSKKEPVTQKKITSKTIPVPSAPASKPEPQTSKTNDTPKVKQGYPDKLPELEDLDVITVNENDYYCDKNNQGVYQMINGDDIGAFLGYYDSQTEIITPVEV